MSPADVPPDLIVRCDDLIRAGYCARGQRSWFREQGFDFRDFLDNGIAAATLVATGDGHAIRAVSIIVESRDG